MQIMSGGLYGLVFEDNSMVKVFECLRHTFQDQHDHDIFTIPLQEQRKFALKSLHDIGFGSSSLEVRQFHYNRGHKTWAAVSSLSTLYRSLEKGSVKYAFEKEHSSENEYSLSRVIPRSI